MEVVSFVVVTITSFELFDTAVRTCMAGSRSLYPFDRNTLGIQFVESEHFWISKKGIVGYALPCGGHCFSQDIRCSVQVRIDDVSGAAQI